MATPRLPDISTGSPAALQEALEGARNVGLEEAAELCASTAQAYNERYVEAMNAGQGPGGDYLYRFDTASSLTTAIRDLKTGPAGEGSNKLDNSDLRATVDVLRAVIAGGSSAPWSPLPKSRVDGVAPWDGSYVWIWSRSFGSPARDTDAVEFPTGIPPAPIELSSGAMYRAKWVATYRGWFSTNGYRFLVEPTHWMPLPNPPATTSSVSAKN